MNNVRELLRDVKMGWRPPKFQSVSQWADDNFYLSPEYAAEAGKFRCIPFQREPLDCISDPRVSAIVIKACTQLLKTTVIQVGTAFIIDRDPGPILNIQPRDSDAKAFSKERIGPMLRDVPCLKGRMTDTSRSGDTIEEKWFRGGMLAITSAGSPGNLARRAIRFLFCDEEDKWVASAGVEGKPFSLAEKRMVTYRHRKKSIRACSPTVDGSAIDLAYKDSDMREFYVTCPHCDHEQSMMGKFYTNVRWDSSRATRKEQASTAVYVCDSCGVGWDDVTRWNAVNGGRWKANGPFNGIAGFWISELYSPWKTLADIVFDFLTKKDEVENLKTFVNTSLAENWRQRGETPEWKRLLERREPYRVGVVPNGGLVLTMSVDVQRADGGRLEVSTMAWGPRKEKWVVNHAVIPGNPTEAKTWAKLTELCTTPVPHELGGYLPIRRVFVDSGDGAVTPFVYEWVRSMPRSLVWAIKGDTRSIQPVSIPKSVETDSEGRKVEWGAILRTIDVHYFKSFVFADLSKTPPTQEELEEGAQFPQGYSHIPIASEFGDEYMRQLCSEELISRKKPRTGKIVLEYQQIRPRNEALDLWVYHYAAAWELGLHHFQDVHWEKLRSELEESSEKSKTPVRTRPGNMERDRGVTTMEWLDGGRPRGWFD